jgi:tetratricopeptide (TPR) repeat protein
MTPEEAMYQEAMSAVQSGDRSRARDLLTRLLKINQGNPEYWLWMSAMVDTPKERSYCLGEVLRRDPHNVAARRGLQIMGQAEPDMSQVVPVRFQKRNWQAVHLEDEGGATWSLAKNWRQVSLVGGAALVVVALVGMGIFGAQRVRQQKAIVIPTDFPIYPTFTKEPSLTPLVRSATPTFVGPTPLWMLMDATYTPTPLYVNTPHPASEAYRIAIRAYQKGEWPDVLSYMQQVVTLEPNAVDLYYYSGEALSNQKLYDEAINLYSKAIAVNPAFAPSYLGRARAGLAIDPKGVVKAQADLELAILKDPNLVDAYVDLGALLLQQKKYEDAQKMLGQAAKLAPDSALVHLLTGQVYLKQGEVVKALDEAKTASALDFTLLPAYRFLGEALQANGQAPDSLKPLQTYVLYETNDAEAFVLLSTAYEANHDMENAVAALTSAFKLNSQSAQVYLRRAQLYMDLNQYDKAIDDYKQAVKLDAESYAANMGLSTAFYLGKYPGDAYMQLERTRGLADTDEKKAELYYWEGHALDDINRPDVAYGIWNQLLALPKKAVKAEWLDWAAQRVVALATSTPTPTATATATATATLRPSRTATATATRTKTPLATPKP